MSNADRILKMAHEFEEEAETTESTFTPSGHPMMQLKERQIPANYDDLKKVYEYLDGPGAKAIWSAIFKVENENPEESKRMQDELDDVKDILLRLVFDYTPFMR